MKVKTNQERWEVAEEHGVREDYRWTNPYGLKMKEHQVPTLRLMSFVEGEKGDYEVVFRFVDTGHTFQETNSRTYKTLSGARKWAADNDFALL